MDYFYVITPVNADPEFSTKRAIVSEIAASMGIEPLFPLDRLPIVALERASQDISKAKFVLADLTHERPSCYFELGLAEAAGADVSIIARGGTPIHQVGYASQVNFYRDLDDYRRLVTEIVQGRISPMVQPIRRLQR